MTSDEPQRDTLEAWEHFKAVDAHNNLKLATLAAQGVGVGVDGMIALRLNMALEALLGPLEAIGEGEARVLVEVSDARLAFETKVAEAMSRQLDNVADQAQVMMARAKLTQPLAAPPGASAGPPGIALPPGYRG